MIAAIDIGSNAIRLAIAQSNSKGLPVSIENHREPLRLGRDVFKNGHISRQTIRRMVRTIIHFQSIISSHSVQYLRTVATSAMREASNRQEVVQQIKKETGIQIHIIDGEEEARLIHMAATPFLKSKQDYTLLIDIGGGSVELILCQGKRILQIASIRVGAVRLVQELDRHQIDESQFSQMANEYIESAEKHLEQWIRKHKIKWCVATGGTAEALGDLRRLMFNKSDGSLSIGELKKMIDHLVEIPLEARIHHLNLRPDRADIIIPGAMVLRKLMKHAKIDKVEFPHVGLKEGILWDLSQRKTTQHIKFSHNQMLKSAILLGEKFHFDKSHASIVSQHARTLFDQTQSLHQLNPKDRILLELAALLHDVGHSIGTHSHHKHSAYIIQNSSLLGLDESSRLLVATIARYHRKVAPQMDHEPFRFLDNRDQELVRKLAALLRIADALDREHAGKVHRVTCRLKQKTLFITMKGRGDLLLEQWAVSRKSELFEHTFDRKLEIKNQ